MRLGISGAEREIVGVSGDVQLTPGWGNDAPLWTPPSVYVPVSQTADGFFPLAHTWFSPSWIVRATGSPTALVTALERAMSEVDSELPFASFRTVDELRAASLGRQQLQAMLLSGFSALALLLACVGIYGLIAGSVSERTRELGIRQVLGATPLATLWLVAAPGILLTLAGVLLGGVLARMTVPVIRHFLWGVTPSDPLTFVLVATCCLLVAAVASLLPALRVLRFSPARTLRDE